MTTPDTPAEPLAPLRSTFGIPRIQLLSVVAVAVFTWVVGIWGAHLNATGVAIYLDAPPFKGTWRTGFTTAQWPFLFAPALLAVGVILVSVPSWWAGSVRRLRFGSVLVGAWAWSLAWTCALALTSDPPSLARPLLDPTHEYLVFARELESPRGFVSGFLENISSYPTHVRGHPPGAVLAFWGLDRLLRTDTLFALGLLVIAASAAPATLLAIRALADEAAARRAALFVGLAPAVIWIGTSADALVMATIAWSVALACMALEGGDGPDSATGTNPRVSTPVVMSSAAGLLAGVAVTLSFGSVVLLAPLGAISVLMLLRGRFRTVAPIALGALVAPALLGAMGYNWLDGYSALREQYYAGVASERPQWFFALSNLAAFSVAIGPAAVAGLSTLRDRRLWWLSGSALAGVALADLSAMSKGEVERIWLPAVPWVLVATASIRTTRNRRFWAVVTMGLTVLLQWKLRPAW